jgi:riboflavin biosynthesis pyrimidine reductase
LTICDQQSVAVRQLVPEPRDTVEPLDVYRDLPVVEGKPAVRLNMISTVDGATAVDGRSGGLGGPADRKVFAALRSLADVLLVAAGLLDELCLTFAPALVSGDAKRILAGPPLQPPPELTLRSVCEEDGYLFFRYRFPGR